MDSAFDERKTIGMNGSGFIEMLARQMTADLQAQRDATSAGNNVALISKGISFGTLIHNSDDTWNVTKVQGVPALSLATTKGVPPSLIIRPFHQVGNVISVRRVQSSSEVWGGYRQGATVSPVS